MLQRKPVFPHVIEMNYQAGQRLGCNVYLVFDGPDWLLIDIGFDETVDEIVELIRQLDFPLSQLQDADRHARRRRSHPGPGQDQPGCSRPRSPAIRLAAEPLATGDKIKTFAEIAAQDIHLEMPPVKLDTLVDEGDRDPSRQAGTGSLAHARATPTASSRSAWANLLFSGDNIYRDGCVGAIDAHHGSDIPAFIKSLRAHSRQRRRVAAAQPRPDLSQGQRPAGSDHRAAGGLPAHGRLRHLRHRLAADGRVGQGTGRGQDARLMAGVLQPCSQSL